MRRFRINSYMEIKYEQAPHSIYPERSRVCMAGIVRLVWVRVLRRVWFRRWIRESWIRLHMVRLCPVCLWLRKVRRRRHLFREKVIVCHLGHHHLGCWRAWERERPHYWSVPCTTVWSCCPSDDTAPHSDGDDGDAQNNNKYGNWDSNSDPYHINCRNVDNEWLNLPELVACAIKNILFYKCLEEWSF